MKLFVFYIISCIIALVFANGELSISTSALTTQSMGFKTFIRLPEIEEANADGTLVIEATGIHFKSNVLSTQLGQLNRNTKNRVISGESFDVKFEGNKLEQEVVFSHDILESYAPQYRITLDSDLSTPPEKEFQMIITYTLKSGQVFTNTYSPVIYPSLGTSVDVALQETESDDGKYQRDFAIEISQTTIDIDGLVLELDSDEVQFAKNNEDPDCFINNVKVGTTQFADTKAVFTFQTIKQGSNILLMCYDGYIEAAFDSSFNKKIPFFFKDNFENENSHYLTGLLPISKHVEHNVVSYLSTVLIGLGIIVLGLITYIAYTKIVKKRKASARSGVLDQDYQLLNSTE